MLTTVQYAVCQDRQSYLRIGTQPIQEGEEEKKSIKDVWLIVIITELQDQWIIWGQSTAVAICPYFNLADTENHLIITSVPLKKIVTCICD